MLVNPKMMPKVMAVEKPKTVVSQTTDPSRQAGTKQRFFLFRLEGVSNVGQAMTFDQCQIRIWGCLKVIGLANVKANRGTGKFWGKGLISKKFGSGEKFSKWLTENNVAHICRENGDSIEFLAV